MPLSFLALGDSYTIGEGVAPAERWPVRLAARLRDEGLPLDAPRILATTGWTTGELAAAMDHAAFEPPYALVSLLIGVNNQYRGGDADTYRGEFAALLRRAATLAGDMPDRVMVLSIPDWGVTRFARENGHDAARIADAIDCFNAEASAETARAGARFVDVTGLSRRYPRQLAGDGLHPCAAQYALWCEAALPAARAILGARP